MKRYKNDRYLLLLGANSGIGRALAHEYAKAGYNIYLASRNKDSINTDVNGDLIAAAGHPRGQWARETLHEPATRTLPAWRAARQRCESCAQ